MRSFAILLVASGLSSLCGDACAAIVFHASLENNPTSTAGPSQFEIGRWSRTTTIKTYDIDGDNFYGSDGYVLMNTSNLAAAVAALDSSIQSTPSYLSAITFSGAATGTGGAGGYSGSFSDAAQVLTPADSGPTLNLGYAGYRDDTDNTAVPLQELFSYTMNRNMDAGEIIRLGVITDSLSGEPRVGVTSLRVVAGADFVDAIMVAGNKSDTLDMYFFDVTGLSLNDEIQIWGGNSYNSGNFTAATISGVTFDSTLLVPEPTAFVLGLLGVLGVALVIRSRRHVECRRN